MPPGADARHFRHETPMNANNRNVLITPWHGVWQITIELGQTIVMATCAGSRKDAEREALILVYKAIAG